MDIPASKLTHPERLPGRCVSRIEPSPTWSAGGTGTTQPSRRRSCLAQARCVSQRTVTTKPPLGPTPSSALTAEQTPDGALQRVLFAILFRRRRRRTSPEEPPKVRERRRKAKQQAAYERRMAIQSGGRRSRRSPSTRIGRRSGARTRKRQRDGEAPEPSSGPKGSW